MADIFTSTKRSAIMRNISGKDTKPEMLVRKELYSMGYRYRLHRKDLPGNPDIVFNKYKKVIFVNGCFWHNHDCKKAKFPETNKDFWSKKLLKNKERDCRNYDKLKKNGWKYLVVWQCETTPREIDKTLRKIDKFLSINHET